MTTAAAMLSLPTSLATDPSRLGGDLDIFCKEGGLKSRMPAIKKVIVDRGYTRSHPFNM